MRDIPEILYNVAEVRLVVSRWRNPPKMICHSTNFSDGEDLTIPTEATASFLSGSIHHQSLWGPSLDLSRAERAIASIQEKLTQLIFKQVLGEC